MTEQEEKARDAKLIEHSWICRLLVNGTHCSLYDFLQEHYPDQLTDEHVKQLFTLNIGEELIIADFKIKRV